jgi:AmmeMemoRadiSam system protein A
VSPLDNGERRTLLEIARRAVILAVEKRARYRVDPVPPGNLSDPAGVFVTLRRGKHLRGCIGRLMTNEPLAQAVADAAKASALEDPRFSPVRREELAALEIEISVLSAFEKIDSAGIEVGKHGLLIERGNQRGLLLPQVASEYRWTAERFLNETCVKAGLRPDCWREPDTEIRGFTAEVFSSQELTEMKNGADSESAPL